MAAITRACVRRPVLTVLVSLLLAAAGAAYTARVMTFVTSNLRLLPQHERYVVLLKEYQRDFGELNDIVVAVEAPRPDMSKAYAARLVEALRRVGIDPSRITYRVDPAYFSGRGLLYMPVADLTTLRDRLFDYQDFIEAYAAQPGLGQLVDGLGAQVARAMVLGFVDLGLQPQQAGDLRFVDSLADQMLARLDGASTYASPWTTALSGGRLDDPDAGYYFSADRRWLFMFVSQRREEGNFTDSRTTIAAIRRAIVDLGRDFPDVRAGVTGGPAISNDEMLSAFHDSGVASALAFALTLGLLLAAFRRVVKPVLILVVLVVSLGWSLGIVTLAIGHLSIFSVMFISIVVGIGTDYGIYFLYRYQEELAGSTMAEAFSRTAERTGPGILLGALTAAGTFYVLMLTDFQGIREFGFVAGTAILMAFVSMITLYPAGLALIDGRGAAGASAPSATPSVEPATWLVRIVGYPRTIVAVTLVLSALALAGTWHVTFDYNMLKLQAKGTESVEWEERILAKAGRSGFAALATASTLDELRQKHAAFAALPVVSRVEDILMLFPEQQPEKTKMIGQLAPIVAAVKVGDPPAIDSAQLRSGLQTLRRRLSVAVAEGGESARREVEPVVHKLDVLIERLGRVDWRQAGPALDTLQGQIAGDFAAKLQSFQENLAPRPVAPGEAPPELRRRFVGGSGRYLLRIHPAVDIWSQEGAEKFVTGLRQVDRDVTGPPITSYEAIGFIRRGYFQGTLYALALVGVVTAVALRTVGGTMLALLPLGLGVLWTLGFMPLFDLAFTLANVWALPLIIGTAAEFGLGIYLRFQEARTSGGPTLARSTVMAVLMNGLTSIVGFASLMVARHRGIFGLGLLLTVGIVSSVVAALLVLPVVLRKIYGDVGADAAKTNPDEITTLASR